MLVITVVSRAKWSALIIATGTVSLSNFATASNTRKINKEGAGVVVVATPDGLSVAKALSCPIRSPHRTSILAKMNKSRWYSN